MEGGELRRFSEVQTLNLKSYVFKPYPDLGTQRTFSLERRGSEKLPEHTISVINVALETFWAQSILHVPSFTGNAGS